MKYIGISSTKRVPITTMGDWAAAVASQKWETNYQTALTKASQTNRIVLGAFTGIPWCGPCNKLEAEVLKSWKFLSWALNRVVLLSVNYPDTTDPLPPLFEQFDVVPVPSVLGIDAQGIEHGRVVGYSSGMGAELWIDAFESEMGWQVAPA